MNKYFLVSVDTEGDNQWDTQKGISTENAKYLPRFQELCEKYSLFPVWLCNYEIVEDSFFVNYMRCKQNEGKCEIGMHLHAWHTPPDFELSQVTDQRDYLIEYPEDIMEQKIKTMTDLISEKFGRAPVSHRSGRWAMDDRYFRLLEKYGYKVDCSVTPHVNWNGNLGRSGVPGTDYSMYSEKPYMYSSTLMEIPVTIRNMHFYDIDKVNGIYSSLKELKHMLTGTQQWLRFFDTTSGYGVKKLLSKVCNEEILLFMVHSSELMPGGSPAFPDDESIEKLYNMLDECFSYAQNQGYKGITMRDYYDYHNKELVD
ncbi:hypothetical protein [Butyrivibrio sp. INlla14]|uniref:hypothetical protein n=1 Tax=Butyrivibrio sp. INlla14 TaxID=1520808 RepID=UPI000877357F|nr:hypothetical protein [Butyrivibrio sp. INlla14]SCY70251.1 hypothetical protein SAMN02910371_03472 [Butyrivibrio sp. INlla14]